MRKCPIGKGNCLECKYFDFDRNRCMYHKVIKKKAKWNFKGELKRWKKCKKREKIIQKTEHEKERSKLRFTKQYYDRKYKKYKPLKRD